MSQRDNNELWDRIEKSSIRIFKDVFKDCEFIIYKGIKIEKFKNFNDKISHIYCYNFYDVTILKDDLFIDARNFQIEILYQKNNIYEAFKIIKDIRNLSKKLSRKNKKSLISTLNLINKILRYKPFISIDKLEEWYYIERKKKDERINSRKGK